MAKKRTKFHPFPRLPAELRTRIWELAQAEPRVVEIRVKRSEGTWGDIKHISSPTKSPALLHACRESRRCALKQSLYQKAFTLGTRPRYTWVNFELDMISIKPISFSHLEPEKALIQRLRMEGPNDEGFLHFQSKELRGFPNLKEVHVVCTDGLMSWRQTTEAVWFGTKNVKYIDMKPSGRMVTTRELEDMFPGF